MSKTFRDKEQRKKEKERRDERRTKRHVPTPTKEKKDEQD